MQERLRSEQEKWRTEQEIAKAQTKDALFSMKETFAAELREANKEYSSIDLANNKFFSLNFAAKNFFKRLKPI